MISKNYYMIMNNFSDNDLKFKLPFTCLVAGPQSSGKTVLVRKLLKYFESLFLENIDVLNVIWCYGVWQELYAQNISDNVAITYNDGLISETDLDHLKPHIIIIDDLMTELGGNKNLTNLFTKISHHKNISVIFIVQNLFHQGKEMRNISLNSNYIILLRSTRDKMQIMSLGKQIFPKNVKYFEEAYNDATSKNFGYLLIDMKSDTPSELILRTNIFPKENIKDTYATIYLPKNVS